MGVVLKLLFPIVLLILYLVSRFNVNKLIRRTFWWVYTNPDTLVNNGVPNLSGIAEDLQIMAPLFEQITAQQYFRMFKVDLEAECPIFKRKNQCLTKNGCLIIWSKSVPQAFKDKPVEYFNYGLKNGSIVSDELTEKTSPNPITTLLKPQSILAEHVSSASYVDLYLNPMRNTGYTKTPIWTYIYKENCMGRVSNPLHEKEASLLDTHCMEEESFYKVISAFQFVISVHVAEKYKKSLYKRVEDFFPYITYLNLPGSPYSMDLYKRLIQPYPDRAVNLHFTFSLIMRTLCSVQEIIRQCNPILGDKEEDQKTKVILTQILTKLNSLNSCKKEFMESPIFVRKASLALQQFKNISKIMDCIECESCRVHAKVQTLGLYISLKANSLNSQLSAIERNELIALINTAQYFASAITIITKFQARVLILQIISTLLCLLSVSFFIVKCCKKKTAFKDKDG